MTLWVPETQPKSGSLRPCQEGRLGRREQITVERRVSSGVVEMGDEFFEPRPDEVPEPPARPAWMGPPAATFSGLIPLQRTIAAYAQGCVLELNVAVRVDDQLRGAAANRFRKRVTELLVAVPPGRELTGEVLRFGVQFTDGRTASSRSWWHDEHRESAPEPPVLIGLGSPGFADPRVVSMQRPLWLWPLPPPEPFDLVVEWPAFGIPLTRSAIDGAHIADAAEQAMPYWPTP
jgi:hypothetical protein